MKKARTTAKAKSAATVGSDEEGPAKKKAKPRKRKKAEGEKSDAPANNPFNKPLQLRYVAWRVQGPVSPIIFTAVTLCQRCLGKARRQDRRLSRCYGRISKATVYRTRRISGIFCVTTR